MIGEENPDTLGSLHNLGSFYGGLKNLEKALEYYERALEGKKESMLEKDLLIRFLP